MPLKLCAKVFPKQKQEDLQLFTVPRQEVAVQDVPKDLTAICL